MNDFLAKLANSSMPAQSSEHLKLLGKRAVSRFAAGQAPSLTEAVTEVVSGEELTRDQVSRISELANQEAWKSFFHEGGQRETNFAPADAESVLGHIRARPEKIDASRFEELDFDGDVPDQVPASDIDLAAMFGLSKDSPEYAALNPVAEEQRQSEKTASMVDVARYALDNSASMLAEAGETFYRLVKQAHLDEGAGVLQIAKAVGIVIDDPDFAKDCMQKVAARLEAEGVKFNRKDELEKVAHALVVNFEHPLLQAAANLERTAYSHYSAFESHEKLAQTHNSAVRNLRQKLKGSR